MAKIKAGPRFMAHEILRARLYQRGMLHEMPTYEKAAAMAHLNIGIVVALAPPKPDPGLLELDAEGKLEYLLVPIPDGNLKPEVGASLLLLAASVARRAVLDGVAVLTHCRAGRNRSGLFSALLLREWLGLSGAAAMERVRLQRPEALANPSFEEFLMGLPPLYVPDPVPLPQPIVPDQMDLFATGPKGVTHATT